MVCTPVLWYNVCVNVADGIALIYTYNMMLREEIISETYYNKMITQIIFECGINPNDL